jgi:hypothetical protein
MSAGLSGSAAAVAVVVGGVVDWPACLILLWLAARVCFDFLLPFGMVLAVLLLLLLFCRSVFGESRLCAHVRDSFIRFHVTFDDFIVSISDINFARALECQSADSDGNHGRRSGMPAVQEAEAVGHALAVV